MDSQATYLLALQSIPRVGTWTAVRAARAFPNPADLLAANEEVLVANLDRRFATPFMHFERERWPDLVKEAEAHVARHAERGIQILSIDGEGYPPLMRLAPSPAPLLYVRGSLEALSSADTVAVVGTREPTPSGLTVAHRLAWALTESGFTIVSGLAKGIDAAGHEGALEAMGRTVAVMGSAIDRIYPAVHRDLAARIESSGGALVSEYPIDFVTSGRHFVERDRLQAAMSVAVVAVQTGVEGGTLHTVRFAREARRLIVVPRPLSAEADHPSYGGILQLIEADDVAVLDGASDYPVVIQRIRAHRDRLLSGDASSQAPTAPVAEGQATLDLL